MPEKIDSYIGLIHALDAEASILDERAKALIKTSDSFANLKARLLKTVLYAMETLSLDEIKGVEQKFVLKRNPPSTDIYDEEKLPPQWKNEKVNIVVTPDKTRIKRL